MPKPRPSIAVLTAAVEVLRRELETMRKRCRGCPHSRKAIGFETDARGRGLDSECTVQDGDGEGDE